MSPELRKQVLAMRAVTASVRDIAAVLRCDEAEVVRVLEAAAAPPEAVSPPCFNKGGRGDSVLLTPSGDSVQQSFQSGVRRGLYVPGGGEW